MIPVFLPYKDEIREPQLVLAGDVGGTKANLALFKVLGEDMEMLYNNRYPSSEYDTFTDIVLQFIKDCKQTPDKICLGVAGPVIKGTVEFTNLNWKVSTDEIISKTGIQKVMLINDLEATAYGLACLKDEDIYTISDGVKQTEGNIAIIAPGTGLGEAGMFKSRSAYHPFATEGGHSEFAPRTQQDIKLLQHLQSTEGVVSWEHVISGPGIYRIYEFLRDVEQMDEPAWLTEMLQEESNASAVVSKMAIEKKAEICQHTMHLFVEYLARESASLVLKLKSVGGLFIGGGIPPKIINLLQTDLFFKTFLDCDRMQDLIKEVPVYVVLNDNTALLGAGLYGAYVIAS
ncbi:MAG: glucokinase [Filimonas sp.]|nr:glucokinase [Filimonas sp.]